MRVIDEYPFNKGEIIKQKKKEELDEIYNVINNIDAEKLPKKSSEEQTSYGDLFYSPTAMNEKFREDFYQNSWKSKRIPCKYKNINKTNDKFLKILDDFILNLSKNTYNKTKLKEEIKKYKEDCEEVIDDSVKLNGYNLIFKKLEENNYIYNSAQAENKYEYKLSKNIQSNELIYIFIKDLEGYREMDFVKNKLGVEVQFGKYSFMVYNVCAKMTIFNKQNHIIYGVEIVPIKKLQEKMSTGVSFYEQFVWDLQNRGVSDIDIPVLVIGIDV